MKEMSYKYNIIRKFDPAMQAQWFVQKPIFEGIPPINPTTTAVTQRTKHFFNLLPLQAQIYLSV